MSLVFVELHNARLFVSGYRALQHRRRPIFSQLHSDEVAVSIGGLCLALQQLDAHLFERPLGIDEIHAARTHEASQ